MVVKIKSRIRQVLLIFLISGLNLKAQQNILLNQSPYNLYILSPAAIGLNDHIITNCHYKKNWLGLADSPELTQLTIDGPTAKNKLGLGLSLINEKAGIFSKTYMTGAFRYRVKLNAAHHLMFGVAGGFQRQLSDFSRIRADVPEEFSHWPLQQAVTVPDAAFGILYNYKRMYITLSAYQVLNRNFIYREPVFNQQFQYKPIAHYIAAIQNTFILRPQIWEMIAHFTLRTPQGLPLQFDISNSFIYKNKLLLSFGYRPQYAVYCGLGCNLTERLSVRYFYEYSAGIQATTMGGHEIGLRFALAGNNSRLSKNEVRGNGKEMDEIFEALGKYDQQIQSMNQKVDSLDKNLLVLKTEIERLKNQQLSPEEINNAIDRYFDNAPGKNKPEQNSPATEKKEKFRIIRSEQPSGGYDTISGSYRIVFGVYQLINYAKEYQKLIRRETGMETLLIQIPDHPKKYIYVCEAKEYSALKISLQKLEEITSELSKLKIEITKGKPWILQISNN